MRSLPNGIAPRLVLLGILLLALGGCSALAAAPTPAAPAPTAPRPIPTRPLSPDVPPSTAAPIATPTPSLPTAIPIGSLTTLSVTYRDLWLVDARRGWLTGAVCPASLAPCEGLIVATSDGGTSWQAQYRGAVVPGPIQFVGDRAGWTIGPRGACQSGSCPSALLRTTDGGEHWTVAYQTDLRLAGIAFSSATDGWLLGESCAGGQQPPACAWRFLTTQDGGRTWRETELPIRGSAVALSRPTPRDGWIAASLPGSGVALLATHDSGATWRPLPSPAISRDAFALQLFFRSPTQGWLLAGEEPGAGLQVKALFGTTDGGQTWTRLAWTGSPDPGGPSDHGLPSYGYVGPIDFSSESDGWIAEPRGGLLRTTDAGRTWNRIAPDALDRVADVRFVNAIVGWALGGQGLWTTTDGGRSWQEHQIEGINQDGG